VSFKKGNDNLLSISGEICYIGVRFFQANQAEKQVFRNCRILILTVMELVCEKYNEKMQSDSAACRHPKEYCKYRTSCIIHFMAGDSGEYSDDAVEKKMIQLNFAKNNGLLPVIAQDYSTNQVLMLAYTNEEAWNKTRETGKAHYWSRSRQKLWLKGETSKHYQVVREILVDCDEDTLIYRIEQLGGAACHTGHGSCFYRLVENDHLKEIEGLVFDPREVYK